MLLGGCFILLRVAVSFTEAAVGFQFLRKGGIRHIALLSSAHHTRLTTQLHSSGTPSLRFIPVFAKNIILPSLGINALLSRFAWCTTQGHRAMPSYIANRKGETLMKAALVRILTIATLATSISAFAADDPKQNDAAAASTQQQSGCAAYAHKDKKQKNAKPRRDDQRTDQEKELDRLLMGMYG
jgi:hypothetical protein